MYFISIFLKLEHIENFTNVKKISQFWLHVICLHAIFLLAPVFKCANLCIYNVFAFGFCIVFSFIYQKTIIVFHEFRSFYFILLVQREHNSIKRMLCSTMFSYCCATLNRKKLEDVSDDLFLMAYCKKIVPTSSWY